mgnify:CR=1 FL=1
MGETDLEHKVLAIVEEQGAERATYALKLLQSEKQLQIASTGKDPNSGKMVTEQYSVEGPVVLLAHGWPESWYSWRHQIRALADAGYRALAPDMHADVQIRPARYRRDDGTAPPTPKKISKSSSPSWRSSNPQRTARRPLRRHRAPRIPHDRPDWRRHCRYAEM